MHGRERRGIQDWRARAATPLRRSWQILPGLLIMLLVLNACGFQLRGRSDEAAIPQNIWIKSDSSGKDVADRLKTRIKDAGGSLVESPEEASVTLHILKLSDGRQSLTLSSSASAAERLLTSTLRYRLQIAGAEEGTEIDDSALLEASRVMIRDRKTIFGDDNQRALSYEELHEELTEQLLAVLVNHQGRRSAGNQASRD